jgi:polar amino acid transport system substrate-binding protein
MIPSTKNHWRSLVAVLAAGLLVFAACGDDGGDEPGGDGGNGGNGGTEGPSVETIEEGILQVGSCLDYPPFESVKGDDEVGFDVDLSEAIAKELGLEVQWVRTDFDVIFTSVAAQEFDMVAAASTITPKRQQTVDFSDPYFNALQALTVNTGETPDIQTIDDLSEGDEVAVQKGTTGETYAQENVPEGVDVRSFQSVGDAFTDLEAGQVQAVINDNGSSGAEVAERPGLEIMETYDTDEVYGFAFSKENPELTLAVNDALKTLIEDGTYQEIFQEYFPGAEVPAEFQPSS